MGGALGVKETKEALLAAVVLGKYVADLLKDGVQVSDAVALGTKLVGDEKFRNLLKDGADKIELVPKELGELDFADIIELAKALPELLTVLKGE